MSTIFALRLYCEVNASYLLHSDSKGHTGYTISLYDNRSVKQTVVATSSTHAKARAIFTLAKEHNFLIALYQELQITLGLPAIIMEDNSAVVSQQRLRIHQEVQTLLDGSQLHDGARSTTTPTCIPSPSDPPNFVKKTSTGSIVCYPKSSSHYPAAKNISVSNINVDSQPSNERKRLWLPAATNISDGAKRRKEHLDRYVTRPASDSTTDADINVPAV